MKEIDRERFSSILIGTCEIFGQEMGKAGLLQWWNLMAELSIDDFERAMGKHLGNSEHMPKPADIFTVLRGYKSQPMDLKDEALLAVPKIFTGISYPGGNRSVCFDDAVINLTIDRYGGWPKVCHAPDDQWIRKDLAAIYAACVKDVGRSSIQECNPPLMLRGEHHEPEPKFVGDRRRIIEWHELVSGKPSPWVDRLLVEAKQIEDRKAPKPLIEGPR